MNSARRLTHPQAKYYQRLLQKKYRREEKKFLVEGVHLVDELVRSDWEVETILLTNDFLTSTEAASILQMATAKRIRVFVSGGKILSKLSDTATPQGAFAVAVMREYNLGELWKSSPDESLIIALQGVADPGNAGSIIRTCDWFGVQALMFAEDSVELYNPKVVRSSMGSIFHLPIVTDVPLATVLEEAKSQGFVVYATTPKGGREFSPEDTKQRKLIVFGNESRGVTSEVENIADHLITIPRFGKAESLNVASSCSVVLGLMKLGYT